MRVRTYKKQDFERIFGNNIITTAQYYNDLSAITTDNTYSIIYYNVNTKKYTYYDERFDNITDVLEFLRESRCCSSYAFELNSTVKYLISGLYNNNMIECDENENETENENQNQI